MRSQELDLRRREILALQRPRIQSSKERLGVLSFLQQRNDDFLANPRSETGPAFQEVLGHFQRVLARQGSEGFGREMRISFDCVEEYWGGKLLCSVSEHGQGITAPNCDWSSR